jgi:hypothetical protein
MTKNHTAILLLCLLAGCSSHEPNAGDIAGILAARGNTRIDANDITKLDCKKVGDKFFCEFLLRDRPGSMTLATVGGGAFSEFR